METWKQQTIDTYNQSAEELAAFFAGIGARNKDIDIAFAGHTHGFQFGIEIPGFKWSPSQYVYKQWAGLYKEDNQYLYVNRGFGYLGYPGRIGMPPELTIIELKSA